MSEPDNSLLIIDVEKDSDLLQEFVHEAREHLAHIEQGALALEENPTDSRTLDTLFAAFHTFKGIAGLLNLAPIKNLAHELESLLDLARHNKLRMTPAMIDLVLKGMDLLRECVQRIEKQLQGNQDGLLPVSTQGIIQNIHAAIQSNISSPLEVHSPADALHSRDLRSSKSVIEHSTVRVDVQKLNAVADLALELVNVHSLAMEDVSRLTTDGEGIRRSMERLGNATEKLQELVLAIRRVPIRSTFQKMQRLVRDLARQAGKQVQLTLIGEETELNRTLAEGVSDPILHMVRNSIDHGIETPSVRRAAGKPEVGAIQLKAFRTEYEVTIEVSDDGVGLDRDAILRKAVELGLVAADARPTEQEVFNLIFSAGLSTSQIVSDISGRGVGMDVVRRNVEKLSGKIDIQSVPGRSLKFTIRLPSTRSRIRTV